MRDKPLGVHAAVRARASYNRRGDLKKLGKDLLKDFLEGLACSLALPAFVAGAVKGDGEFDRAPPKCHLESRRMAGREIPSHDLMRFLASLEMTTRNIVLTCSARGSQ